jgi:hypothetical protein
MAFHLPKEPIRNKREFVLYLLATAAGVLLALSLERTGEWWRDRSLVREARENLMREIAGNRQQIANWRKGVPQIQKNLEEVVVFVEESLKTGRSAKTSLTVNFGLLQLASAAWRAAETTGALAHMPYEESKLYAELYGLQEDLRRSQAVLMDELAAVMGFFATGKDPTRDQRPQDLDRFGDRVRTLSMRVVLTDNFAKGVDTQCELLQKRNEGK